MRTAERSWGGREGLETWLTEKASRTPPFKVIGPLDDPTIVGMSTASTGGSTHRRAWRHDDELNGWDCEPCKTADSLYRGLLRRRHRVKERYAPERELQNVGGAMRVLRLLTVAAVLGVVVGVSVPIQGATASGDLMATLCARPHWYHEPGHSARCAAHGYPGPRGTTTTTTSTTTTKTTSTSTTTTVPRTTTTTTTDPPTTTTTTTTQPACTNQLTGGDVVSLDERARTTSRRTSGTPARHSPCATTAAMGSLSSPRASTTPLTAHLGRIRHCMRVATGATAPAAVGCRSRYPP